jgi:hypothetical protein
MWHSCVRWPLASHFKGRPKARQLFDRLRESIEAIGPVRVVSSRTRISFMTRVRFAGIQPRRDWLRVSLWLTRRVDSPRWVKVERYAPECYVHELELREYREIDAGLRRHLRESYAIGRQEHLMARAAPRHGAAPSPPQRRSRARPRPTTNRA